ncbi:hypothetical protein BGZ65_000131, partial [Modicella reniformis]
MSDLDFVRTAGPKQSEHDQDHSGPRLNSRSVVDPSMSQYYMADEKVFPAGVYSRAPVFGVLSEMNMRSKFDAPFILDRIRTLSLSSRTQIRYCDLNDLSDLSDLSEVVDPNGGNNGKDGASVDRRFLEEHVGVLLALYTRLNTDFSPDFSTREMQVVLRSKSWVLAKSSNDTNQHLYCTRECRPESEAVLIGDQMPHSVFKFNNKDLIHCMGWDEPPPLNKVLAHFLKMIDRLATEAVSDKDAFAFYEIYCHLLERT